jgi:hypothetical protein
MEQSQYSFYKTCWALSSMIVLVVTAVNDSFPTLFFYFYCVYELMIFPKFIDDSSDWKVPV